MEDGRDMNADIAIRRMKNRERQRRYRAKKRLEAENRKSAIIRQSNFSQAALQPDSKTLSTFSQELQSNSNLNAFVTRILCTRKWKKDARNAHKLDGHRESRAGCTGLESMLEMKIEHENPSSPITCVTTKTVLARRDWKSDARNKMNWQRTFV
ncbi:hypothetical protein ACFE04_011750 [Oxalis oulophora]